MADTDVGERWDWSNPNSKRIQDPYTGALEALSEAVHEPVVPGRGESWSENVIGVAADVRDAWGDHVDHELSFLRAAARTGPDVALKLDSLRDRSEHIKERLRRLILETEERYEALLGRVEADAEPDRVLLDLRDRWIGWIEDSRNLEADAEDWIAEEQSGAGEMEDRV
ncbi:MAG TPA: hypothetical protein VK116_14425 [Planctomycetota bacterium]|nr:hypothetical protein [Planctomycetota bacterium]